MNNMITKVVNEKGIEIPQPRKIYSHEETIILAMRKDEKLCIRFLKYMRKWLKKQRKHIEKQLKKQYK